MSTLQNSHIPLGESFSVVFFALSASPRLPVEQVMGRSLALLSGSLTTEPAFFARIPNSGRSCPVLLHQQAPARKPNRSML